MLALYLFKFYLGFIFISAFTVRQLPTIFFCCFYCWFLNARTVSHLSAISHLPPPPPHLHVHPISIQTKFYFLIFVYFKLKWKIHLHIIEFILEIYVYFIFVIVCVYECLRTINFHKNWSKWHFWMIQLMWNFSTEMHFVLEHSNMKFV